jgi:hypothetical protein
MEHFNASRNASRIGWEYPTEARKSDGACRHPDVEAADRAPTGERAAKRVCQMKSDMLGCQHEIVWPTLCYARPNTETVVVAESSEATGSSPAGCLKVHLCRLLLDDECVLCLDQNPEP